VAFPQCSLSLSDKTKYTFSHLHIICITYPLLRPHLRLLFLPLAAGGATGSTAGAMAGAAGGTAAACADDDAAVTADFLSIP
jgi:hypothetical protein